MEQMTVFDLKSGFLEPRLLFSSVTFHFSFYTNLWSDLFQYKSKFEENKKKKKMSCS